MLNALTVKAFWTTSAIIGIKGSNNIWTSWSRFPLRVAGLIWKLLKKEKKRKKEKISKYFMNVSREEWRKLFITYHPVDTCVRVESSAELAKSVPFPFSGQLKSESIFYFVSPSYSCCDFLLFWNWQSHPHTPKKKSIEVVSESDVGFCQGWLYNSRAKKNKKKKANNMKELKRKVAFASLLFFRLASA